jgi:hypothetical protein
MLNSLGVTHIPASFVAIKAQEKYGNTVGRACVTLL